MAVCDDLAVIGAPRDNDMGEDSGSAYVYRYDGSDWVQANKIMALDGTPDDRFGYCVGISGGNAIIGANWADSAYIFGGLNGEDCNENGAIDACDILGGGALDCNANFVPDDCDIADGTSEDTNENGIPDECECPGDVNGDETVNVTDLLALLAAWGESDVPEDINDDGIVNVADLLLLLAAWGDCP